MRTGTYASRRQAKIWCLVAVLLVFAAGGYSQRTREDPMKPPGTIIDRSPDPERVHLGSPSLAILSDGSYVASHDFFGPGTSYDTTAVFRSDDKGETWKQTATLKGQFWSRLFVCGGKLYILGSGGRWGTLVIRRSDDGGRSWTEPEDADSGIILPADERWLYGIASGAMLEWRGRLYKAAARRRPGPRKWGQPCEFVVLSAEADADLLRASSWRVSTGAASHPHPAGMFLTDEGNIVADRNGKLFDILRVHEPERGGVAGMLNLSADGKQLTFDREGGYFPFAGGCKKFTIRYDPQSDRWWSLTNWAQEESLERAVNAERTRNTLALTSAKTLDEWEVRSVVLYHRDVRTTGFQYADWHFDGDDIVAVVRTAFGDAPNCHDSNYLTFHRIGNFRERTMKDAPQSRRPDEQGSAGRQISSSQSASACRTVRPLADEHVTVYESPDADRVFSYSPGIARLDGGRLVATAGPRLVATIDLGGPGAADLEGPKYRRDRDGRAWQGRVYTSDDGGETWRLRSRFPFMHARPFAAGDALYVLGHAGDLKIMRSDDGGNTWGEPVKLTEGQFWHQAPCNVHYANGCVYLVMERRVTFDVKTWYVGEMAPVLMRGRVEADLTHRDNWTFASELSFRDVVANIEKDPDLDFFGVPFFDCPYPAGSMTAARRNMAPMGWLETNVVQITDPDHLWHDPSGRTFHLFMRAHTGGTGYAAMAKVVEHGQEPGTGTMKTMLETAPSGRKMLFVPMPGGQMKFHVLYDEESELYWLLSTQATDSMTRPDRLPPDRYNLPNNERRRLQLHFSKNMVDWCFAGLVAAGPTEVASRHYASMAIDGDDLVILSRSGDERARTPHDGNLITFHRIEDFRDLAY